MYKSSRQVKEKIPLLFIFILNLLLSWFSLPFLFSSVRLSLAAPLIVLSCLYLRIIPSLCLSILLGLSWDLLSHSLPFGSYAITFALTTFFAHRNKKAFHIEKTLPFFFYTMGISTLISSLLLPFSLVSHHPDHQFLSFFSDLLISPFFDALYGLIALYIPHHLLPHLTDQNFFICFTYPFRRLKNLLIALYWPKNCASAKRE